MPGQYLYNVEFTLDDYDLWTFPEHLRCADDLPTFFHFKMDPKIDLEITDEEFLEQVNCDKKIIKSKMFSLNEEQVNCELNGKIIVYKLECPGQALMVGNFKFSNIHSIFKLLMEQFDKQAGQCATEPMSKVDKNLVQLLDEYDQPSGSVLYTLRFTCYGPYVNENQFDSYNSMLKNKNSEVSCLDRSVIPDSCPSNSSVKGNDFDEYSAEINGNQLIIRINKDSSHLVTRVYDSNMDFNGNEIKRDKNIFSICGCDQQIDFKFPKNFSCGDTKPKKFICGPDSIMTEFQKQTSCVGKSFKNSCVLPVIRGNLKYPGQLDDGLISFDLYDKCNPRDATQKYRKVPTKTRGACLQVDGENLNRELNGKCKIPRGIEVCQLGCSDPDTDVFILKMGRKNSDKKGYKNEIELEMRTPKSPDFEIKKMETREIQVDEEDFETKKVYATVQKVEEAPSKVAFKPQQSKLKVTASKGFVQKKVETKSQQSKPKLAAPKGFVKKKDEKVPAKAKPQLCKPKMAATKCCLKKKVCKAKLSSSFTN